MSRPDDTFAAPPARSFVIDTDIEEIRARWPDGRPAWTIAVDNPMYDEAPPIEINGQIVASTSAGDIFVLRLA